MTGKRVVLRAVSDARDLRHLEASLTKKGDLVLEGRDYGDAVEQIFGVREYEWAWTIRVADIPILLKAMGHSTGVLSALMKRFSGEKAGELKSFLDSQEVPHETWSRVGD